MGRQLTIEDAIETAMARTDPKAPNALELDAKAIAAVLIRHWGDDAPRVLARILELAHEEIAKWAEPDSREGDR